MNIIIIVIIIFTLLDTVCPCLLVTKPSLQCKWRCKYIFPPLAVPVCRTLITVVENNQSHLEPSVKYIYTVFFYTV